jgi:hypothetical protein
VLFYGGGRTPVCRSLAFNHHNLTLLKQNPNETNSKPFISERLQ